MASATLLECELHSLFSSPAVADRAKAGRITYKDITTFITKLLGGGDRKLIKQRTEQIIAGCDDALNPATAIDMPLHLIPIVVREMCGTDAMTEAIVIKAYDRLSASSSSSKKTALVPVESLSGYEKKVQA